MIDIFGAITDVRTDEMREVDSSFERPTRESVVERLRTELFALVDELEQAIVEEGAMLGDCIVCLRWGVAQGHCMVCVARRHVRRCGVVAA